MAQISQTLHWQPSLQSQNDIVEGFADVEQAIHIILATPKGSVPHRPEFGADILPLQDMDFNTAVPLFIQRATDAILTNEPRVEKLRITAKQYNQRHGFAGAIFNIAWTPVDGLIPQNMTYRV